MHELSLATAMVAQIAEVAAREGSTRVTRVEVEMGALSGVEREPFEFAFPIAAEGSVAARAELVIHEIPVTVRCRDCGAESALDDIILVCPACSGVAVKVVAGRDFLIRSLEVL